MRWKLPQTKVPKITKITPQKVKNRVNVYLDGKFGFGIDYESYVLLKLKVEGELTDGEIEKIKARADFQKNLAGIINFASRRPHSEFEFRSWLTRKKIPQDQHDKLLAKLAEYKYLDDAEFARWWVGERTAFSTMSQRQIIAELKQKKIDAFVIQDVVQETSLNDAAAIKKLIAKNAYKWEKLDGRDKRKKITEYLARKGFLWDDIKSALDNYDN